MRGIRSFGQLTTTNRLAQAEKASKWTTLPSRYGQSYATAPRTASIAVAPSALPAHRRWWRLPRRCLAVKHVRAPLSDRRKRACNPSEPTPSVGEQMFDAHPHLFLDELNVEQRAAATHSGETLLILAGAGTGKTTTLCARVVWLMAEGVPAERILLLTFTRRVAREMVERARTLAERVAPDRVPTFTPSETYRGDRAPAERSALRPASLRIDVICGAGHLVHDPQRSVARCRDAAQLLCPRHGPNRDLARRCDLADVSRSRKPQRPVA
jgi:UvrD/REP helicase N-terminal domain